MEATHEMVNCLPTHHHGQRMHNPATHRWQPVIQILMRRMAELMSHRNLFILPLAVSQLPNCCPERGNQALLPPLSMAARGPSFFGMPARMQSGHLGSSRASPVDRLTCFSRRQKQDVFATASRDGFTAARKISNDPHPLVVHCNT